MAKSVDLEINEDLQFQRRMWKAERIGWSAMAVLLIGALLGLFGNGPVSWTTESGESFLVEYQRFGRYQAPLQLRFRLQAGLVKDDRLAFEIDDTFLANVQITGMTPKPVAEQPIADGIRFIFSSNAEDGAVPVTVSYQPEHIGLLEPTVRLGHADSLTIRQFIYP